MPSVVLPAMKLMAEKIGGPIGYFGKAVLGVLEDIVNDFDALKEKTSTLGTSVEDHAERIGKVEARLNKLEARFTRVYRLKEQS